MAEQPGTLTLLFTDLVGSTVLGERLGDDAAQALRRAHDRLLREQFERFEGRVVKGTGDGFIVTFASARQGVESAIAIQRAIAAQQAEGRYGELQVRVGIHTGEPVVEGDDLFGSDVNLAARIVAEAEGGQILASQVTQSLVHQYPDLQFQPAGERALKGFQRAVPLLEVAWQEERSLRPRLTRFVGREEEVAKLRQHLEAATHGEGSLVLIAGEPGVGKTRLVSELAIDAVDRGIRVLSGHAYETEGLPPYLLFAEPLAQYLRGRSPEDVRKRLDGNAPFVAKVLPQLAEFLPDIGGPPPLEPEAERYRLFDGISDVLINIAANDPLLLFLDDLHWADRASILLLLHLARRLKEAPLLVVATYRDVELDDDHPLAALLADATRQRLAERISLAPFARPEAAALIEGLLGAAPARHVMDAIFAAAEGNPFFTEELVRHLQEQDRDLTDPRARTGDWAIPDGVRQVISKRLARLSDDASQVLAYSSVLGRDLSLAKIAAVTGKNEDALIDLLEEALTAHLLQEEGAGFVFAHPLIQETLYQGLSGPRRRQLHLRVAEALERLCQENPEPYLAELAHHYFRAVPSGDIDKAIDYATRAARRAIAQLAYEEGSHLYSMALQGIALKPQPNEVQRCALQLTLGEAQLRAGELQKAIETFDGAAKSARKLADTESLARAALGFDRARASSGSPLRDASDALLQDALAGIGTEDGALRARLLATRASALYYSASRGERERLSRDAVEMARRLGDTATLAFTLGAMQTAIWGPQNVEERLAAASEVLELAKQAEDRELALQGHNGRIISLLELGDLPGVEAEMEAVESLAGELRQPLLHLFTIYHKVMLCLLRGRFEEGEQLAQEAFSIGQRIQSQDALVVMAVQTFALRREQGRLAELEPAIDDFVQRTPQLRWLIALAYIHTESGQEEAARREMDQLAVNDFTDLPLDRQWLIGVTLLTESCASLSDVRRAAVLYPLLLPYAGRNVVVGSAIASNGAASRYLGMLAATLARWGEAGAHFEDALQMNERMGARPYVAHTEHDYARMLLARGEPADGARAVALLEQSIATAQELGMNRLMEKASTLRTALFAAEDAKRRAKR